MRIALVAAAILAAAPAARAGKARPTAAEARKAAQAWMDAMTSQDPESTAPRARALTATPFFSIAVVDGADPPACPEAIAGDAKAVDKALVCLRGAIARDGSYGAPTGKGDGMVRAYHKQLAAMAKHGTVVALEAACQGTFNDVVFVTVKGDGGAVKVVAVLSAHGACGD